MLIPQSEGAFNLYSRKHRHVPEGGHPSNGRSFRAAFRVRPSPAIEIEMPGFRTQQFRKSEPCLAAAERHIIGETILVSYKNVGLNYFSRYLHKEAGYHI